MAKKRRLWREQKALEILRKHPEWSNNQVGEEMVRLGYVKDRGYLNKRIWKEQYGNKRSVPGKRSISEPWRRMMLKEHGDKLDVWNRYHKESDET